MSNPQPSPVSGNVVVLAVVGLLVVEIVAACAVAIAIEDGARAASLIGLILAPAGVAIPSLIALARIEKLGGQVYDLANGGMDAKIRAGIADVLPAHLIDPSVEEQLVVDRARRDKTP